MQLSYRCLFPWKNSTMFSWVSGKNMCFQRHYSWWTPALCFIKILALCADSTWSNAVCTMSLSQLLSWSEGRQRWLRVMSYHSTWMLSIIISLHSDPNCNVFTDRVLDQLNLTFFTLNSFTIHFITNPYFQCSSVINNLSTMIMYITKFFHIGWGV